MSSSTSILNAITFLSKELYIPKIKEVMEFHSEELSQEQYLNSIQELRKASKVRIQDDYITDITPENLNELIDKRNALEIDLRNLIKSANKLKEIKGVCGLFISVLNLHPIIFIVGEERNSKYISRLVQNKLKGFKNLFSLQYIKSENEILYNDRMFFSFIKAIPIVDNDRVYSTILGLYFNSLGERFPNLPIDILKGIRISKTAKFLCNIPKYQVFLSAIYRRLSL